MPCKPPPPPPLTVIVDTREQLPLVPFHSEAGKRILVPTERAKLDEGDYSAKGYEHEVRVEWKNIDDAVKTAIGSTKLKGRSEPNWERFKREIARKNAAGLRRFWVFIEGSRGDVFGRNYWGKADPKSVLGRWDSLEVDLDVSVLWCGSREEGGRMLAWYLRRWIELRQREEAGARAVEST
jgi:ERCC4-type nuclease